MMTPAVVDMNGDDVPDVVFSTFGDRGTSGYGGSWSPGPVRAISGADGSELWTAAGTASDPYAYDVNAYGGLAVGDIDGDGLPEVIATHHSLGGLIAFEHDGTFKWHTPIASWGITWWGSASLADLDADGLPEIVAGASVLSGDGSLLWEQPAGWSDSLSVVADLDLDGSPEIVTGKQAYRADGTLYWDAPLPGSGYPAVANFDTDPNPEIVVVSGAGVYLLEHDGTLAWGGIANPGGYGGPPTVADFDGDNQPEIGVAGGSQYVVFETDGSVKWQQPTQDTSSSVTGSSVFDFEGDGKAEVVYADELYLRIYRGDDGQVLYQLPSGSATTYEYPVIADVDADGNAEIVVAANNIVYGPRTGIYVIGDANDTWVPTRPVWNQYSYHITNVNDDGTIPAQEENSWQVHNTYRLNAQPGVSPQAAPDVTASYLQALYGAGQTNLTARIGNGGEVFVHANVNVAFYDGDPQQGGSLLGVVGTTQKLEPGEFEDVVLTLDRSLLPGEIWVRADDDGFGNQQVNEPDEFNNIHHAVPIAVTPTITITAPRQGERLDAGTSLLVTGNAIGSQIGGTGLRTAPQRIIAVAVNDRAVDALDSAGNFFLRTTIVPGNNIFEVTAIDALGQQATETVTIFGGAPAEGTSEELLFDVTPSFQEAYARTSFDERTGLLYAQMAIENVGQYSVDNPFYVGVRNVSEPTVRVVNETGRTSDGMPYYNFSELVPGSSFDASEITGFIHATFRNPNRTPFTFELVYLAKLNEPPTILTVPQLEAIVGQPYDYDVRATDRDNDPLTYFLVAGPEMMTIDEVTGNVDWQPTGADTGNHDVLIRVVNGRGGSAEQHFVLSVIEPPANRPPFFTSPPVVEAAVNTRYQYNADAADLDKDVLSYSLVESPEGMTMNPTTGEIEWTPTADDLMRDTPDLAPNEHRVVATTADGLGGVATQTYVIHVQPDPANHPPVIVSQPLTDFVIATEQTQFTPIELTPSDVGSTSSSVFSTLPTANPALFGFTGDDVRKVNFDTAPDGSLLSSGTVLTSQYESLGVTMNGIQISSSVYGGPASPPNATTSPFQPGHLQTFTFSEPVIAVGLINTSPDQDLIEYYSPTGDLLFTTRDQQGLPKNFNVDRFVGARVTDNNRIGSVVFANNTGQTELDELIFEVSPPIPEYLYDVEAIDPDNDTLTYEILEGPDGMVIDDTAGVIQWTPTREQLVVTNDDPTLPLLSGYVAEVYAEVPHPIELAFAPDGTLYTGREESPLPDETADFVRIHRVGPGGAPVEEYGNVPRWDPDSVAFDRDGTISGVPGSVLVGGGADTGLISAILPDQTVREILSSPFGPASLWNPSGMTFDSTGRLYATQVNSGQLFVSDGELPHILFEMNVPFSGFAIDAQDNVYAAGRDGTIRIYGRDGGLLNAAFATGLGPVNLAFGLGGGWGTDLYALNGETGELKRIDPSGYITTIGTGFVIPPTFAFGPDGALYVSEKGNNRVLRITPQPAEHPVTVQVADDRGGVDEQQFVVRVFQEGTGEIQGTKFNDLDGDGMRSAPESGLAGWVIYSDQNDNQRRDAGEQFAVTDQQGNYALDRLPPGSYVIREELHPQWNQSLPGNGDSYQIELAHGQIVSGIDFGNYPTGSGNESPVFTSTPPSIAAAGNQLRYDATATDVDHDALVFDVVVKPQGMAVSPTDGVLVWRPRLDQLGLHDVILRMHDGRGGVDLQAFQITVTTNSPPVITSLPTGGAVSEVPFSYRVTAQDADGDPLDYALLDGPVTMMIDQDTGTIAWTPSTGDVGDHVVHIEVSDGSGGVNTQSFTLPVVASQTNGPPEITSSRGPPSASKSFTHIWLRRMIPTVTPSLLLSTIHRQEWRLTRLVW